ncbi:diguanylate cyclase [Rhizobium sp. Root1203]|uniref:GGDEF domain-containing protein n=1 Tax=Rhizobium sp. Root1203 TaxID=1736427 RepID=UPI00070EE33C|nr:GGDEF domain-containing protein [Rhizobium sp. Root1203]KQV30780.1 diguanylate cyclase [Rhizobium sp. Root1203]
MLSAIVHELTSQVGRQWNNFSRRPDDGDLDSRRHKAFAPEALVELAHLKKLFDRSSKAARIGVWECSLPDERLTWTDMVYELFDLPPGYPLRRNEIVGLYSEKSLAELTKLRKLAIEKHEGFSLDAEIVTAKGNRRWIRITATVECEHDVPVRIFGMKQDITAEKTMFDEIRHLAEFDVLTDLPNRVQFQSKFEALCSSDAPAGAVALFLVDLDGFKLVNDSMGHQAGDECLREAAGRLLRALERAEIVARIGGDEFAVLHFCASDEDVERVANIIVTSLGGSFGYNGQRIGIGASVGVAFAARHLAPKDVFAAADKALYSAKTDGKNHYRIAAPSPAAETHAA